MEKEFHSWLDYLPEKGLALCQQPPCRAIDLSWAPCLEPHSSGGEIPVFVSFF